MTSVDGDPSRTGFWRRVGALLVDFIVVLLPFQILVAVLFAQTNGAVQGSFGLVLNMCQPVSQLPEGLEPPPPPDANTIAECRSSLFGFDTAHSLLVSKVVQNGNVTSVQTISYSLGADGKPVDAFHTGWIAALVLVFYLVAMEWSSGATVGKRALGIRTVGTGAPGRVGVPLRKAVVRHLAMWIGVIPALFFAFVVLFVIEDPMAAMATTGYWFGFAIAATIEVAWFIWIIVSISRKRDPIYDRIAGTSALRTG